jgi:predicted ATP-grasp superfamily ATP-dependent carboligase
LDEVSRFFLHWGSDVWVKGPWYEGVRARDWQAVLSAKKRLEATWGLARPLLVQSHIEGTEESIAFCSVSGQLLDAVYMRKRDTTPEGKTWSGSIVPVPADLREQLSHFAALLSWTGGGEIEMIRDRDGQLWLLELNPRFPAWIFGATLAGFNLPSQLVLRQQNHFGSKDFGSPFQFTRVVLEIPVKVPDFML